MALATGGGCQRRCTGPAQQRACCEFLEVTIRSAALGTAASGTAAAAQLLLGGSQYERRNRGDGPAAAP